MRENEKSFISTGNYILIIDLALDKKLFCNHQYI